MSNEIVNVNHKFIKRYKALNGFEGRMNDIIYCLPKENCWKECLFIKHHKPINAIVFFGGDIQDYPETMKTYEDGEKFLDWNLENVALMLRDCFSLCHIIIIKAASCYDNFVPSNSTGVPEHVAMHNSLRHLKELLKNLTVKLREANLVNNDCPLLSDSNLCIIGFSKGCVVLNQFIREFHYAYTLPKDNDDDLHFIKCFHSLYWLDGGHNGNKDTWPNSRILLDTLAALNICIEVHVTPYQICDECRPWIAREEKYFSDYLKTNTLQFYRKVYFSDDVPSIEKHFLLLKEFCEQVSVDEI